jgi:light-regulated signal transduction histidine kinase (bacteriophytochrome)
MNSPGDRPPLPPDYDQSDLRCPGTIQPHGVLLWLPDLESPIQWLSENTEDLLGYPPESILAQPLSVLLTESDLQRMTTALQRDSQGRYRDRCTIQGPAGATPMELIAQWRASGILLELYPVPTPEEPTRSIADLQAIFAQLQKATTIKDLLAIAVQQIRALTYFDRVIAYQFDHQGAGEVIAEAKCEEAIAYQGLHFPETDIPQVARALYIQGMIRYIPDIRASSIALRPAHPALAGEPLDLSLAMLRSVDDCCLAFHHNMGVTALVVLPLIVNQQLWGLFTCHHFTPHWLSISTLDLLFMFNQYLGAILTNQINADVIVHQQRLKDFQSRLLLSLSESERFTDSLTQPDLLILDLVQAQGAAIFLEKGITLLGETPTAEEVLALWQWAVPKVQNFVYATHQLPQAYPPAESYAAQACGMLLLQLSGVQRFSILWFRPEVIQTVNWAGNPVEALQRDGTVMGPRRSFELWQEQIHQTALPWQASEIDNALSLRAAIAGIALRKAEELAQINKELERSNEELQSFAYAASHDLKEPLRGIYNYTNFLLDDYSAALDEVGFERMQTLMKLAQRMDQLIDALLRFSQMRQTALIPQEINLHRLVQSVVEMMQVSRANSEVEFEVRVPRSLPMIQGDQIMLQEVFTNLLSNALKYNDSTLKVVEIGYVTPDERPPYSLGRLPNPRVREKLMFYVHDNGIGIKSQHLQTIFRLFKRLHGRNQYGGGTGAGLTIIKKLVERHGGDIWVESQWGEGSTFWLTLG